MAPQHVTRERPPPNTEKKTILHCPDPECTYEGDLNDWTFEETEDGEVLACPVCHTVVDHRSPTKKKRDAVGK